MMNYLWLFNDLWWQTIREQKTMHKRVVVKANPHTYIALISMMNKQHQVLLLKRKSDVHCPDVWSFPGGKVEENESALAAAKRELLEETQNAGSAWRCLGEHQHQYEDRLLSFSLYACDFHESGQLLTESEYTWCDLDKLRSKKMPDANQALIQIILKDHKKMGY